MVIFMVNVIIILMVVDSADKRVQSVGCGASLTHARMPNQAQKVLIFTGLARLVESDKRLVHA